MTPKQQEKIQAKWEGSNLEHPDYALNHFKYSSSDPQLADFSKWLGKLTQDEKFAGLCEKYIAIQKALKEEKDLEKRIALWKQSNDLILELE